jgi:hypothetical protein
MQNVIIICFLMHFDIGRAWLIRHRHTKKNQIIINISPTTRPMSFLSFLRLFFLLCGIADETVGLNAQQYYVVNRIEIDMYVLGLFKTQSAATRNQSF